MPAKTIARPEDLPQGLNDIDISHVIKATAAWLDVLPLDPAALVWSLRALGGDVEADHQRVARAVEEWVNIREGRGKPADGHNAQRSALLRRLLSGVPSLPYTPPLAFGSPWYALIERAGRHRVAFTPPSGDANEAMLNQFPWKITARGADQEFTLLHEPSGLRVRVSPNPRMSQDMRQTVGVFAWIAERLD